MGSAELNARLSESARKEFTIIVNGEPKKVPTRDVSFEEVVNLAYNGNPPTGPNWIFTVTYRKAAGPKHEGTLTKGQTVEIREGTIFNVTATDKS